MDESRDGVIRVEQGRKRVRAFLGGQLVVDTLRPVLVWEWTRYPTYYVPVEDVRAELVPTGEVLPTGRGRAAVHDLRAGGLTAPRAAVRYLDPPVAELRDLVRVEWAAVDQWFEEDEPVSVHPRDPYKRIDALASSRRVRVELGGVLVADSTRPVILYETGLPPRYYLPLTDVRQDLLRPSALRTSCPYKGTADYWSVEVGGTLHRDVLWGYRTTLPESAKIAGMVAFHDERVHLTVDGAPG
ncbi:DUF427 domain-containing protein [Actinokineospora bangkokensis]|uniref:DUF427 domain-containing protein n=1 Tax=Actinokineospora bangkokensis TaxID=1193682 RepID=A0A1Q9LNK9_9PSEU|nr:DUF427 domain-containing protein [Actinokineospora bangkokensis]OLR93610.1 hypothetical protein BJP25_15130 [Actinokineospora bangkokensis]